MVLILNTTSEFQIDNKRGRRKRQGQGFPVEELATGQYGMRWRETSGSNGDPKGVRTPVTGVRGQCPNH